MKNIIVRFLCIFAALTIYNDFFTALGFEGFYMSNLSKYLVASIGVITITFLKKQSNGPDVAAQP
jgi:hypothetical protein